MRGSPFGKVQPDDDPQAYCNDCGNKYNPYKHGLDCPKCSRQSADDVPVVDPSDYVD
jgi:Zn finger protein HypA/HybF involved in hydrogenase expression